MTMTAADLAVLLPNLGRQEQKTFLNVGCGSTGPHRLPDCFRQPDWKEVRLDINPAVKPDIVASVTDLGMIKDASFTSVWCSHNLEHLYCHEVVLALKELYRVLKPGGFALVNLPDIQQVAGFVAEGKLNETVYTSPAGPITPLDMLYGHQGSIARGNKYMAHKCGFDEKLLINFLLSAGFVEVRVTKNNYYDLWGYAKKMETRTAK